MKCVEFEKQIDLMLDDELNSLQKQSFEQHLEECKSCLKNYQILQRTKVTLQNQPRLLPTEFLDKKILQAFENHHQSQKTSFWKYFLIPKPAFALILIIFAVSCGLAFLIGRMSVSQSQFTKIENLPVQPEPKIERIIEKSEPKMVTVTKYVKVPIYKTIFLNKPVAFQNQTAKVRYVSNGLGVDKDAQNTTKSTNEAVQTRMNFENLQPVSAIRIKVIKKGENNE